MNEEVKKALEEIKKVNVEVKGFEFSDEELAEIYKDVVEAMLDAQSMGKMPLSFWAEYLLVRILGVKPECVNDFVRARAGMYLQIISNEIGGVRDGS